MTTTHPDLERLQRMGLAPRPRMLELPTPSTGEALQDRYRGCLLGGAAGDALGRPAEGRRRSDLREQHADGLRDFQPWRGWKHGPRGTFTDDTQLTIVMAEWLIAADQEPPRAQQAAERILAWGEHGRGIGHATQEALDRMRIGSPWWRSGRPSAGNGAAMRAAPYGLRYAGRPGDLRLMAALGSVPTHADLSAVASAIVHASAVNVCLAATWPLDASRFLRLLADTVSDLELPALPHRATGVRRTLAERILEVDQFLEASADEVFDHFFNGAFVLETIPVVLWCLLQLGGDPEEAMVTAVMGGRDADTNAAVLGNLLGAVHGTTALPGRWIGEDLEDRDHLIGLADRLYDLRWGEENR